MKDYAGKVKRSHIIVCFSVFFVVLILIFLTFSGCAEPEPPSRFIQLLELMPIDAGDDSGFYLIDYEKFWEQLGITMTGPDNQPIGLEEFFEAVENSLYENSTKFNALYYFSHQTGGGRYMFVSTIQDKYIGYGFPDVYAEINNMNGELDFPYLLLKTRDAPPRHHSSRNRKLRL